jgi:hypothetical protein
MQLMAAFANQLFKREAFRWVYTGKPCREAIADAILTLRRFKTPGFIRSELLSFKPQLFHNVEQFEINRDRPWKNQKHPKGRGRCGDCKRWGNRRPTQGKQSVMFVFDEDTVTDWDTMYRRGELDM